MKCCLCRNKINGRYFNTDQGAVCKGCHDPRFQCFTCHSQMAPNDVMHLADYRVICPTCSIDAVFQIDQSIINGVSRILHLHSWFPRKPIEYRVVDLNTLGIITKRNRNRGSTTLGNCLTKYIQPFLGKTEVTNHLISILFGLPLDVHRAILVHELFHAWLHEFVSQDEVSGDDAEWLCDNMALHYLIQIKANPKWIEQTKYSRDRYQSSRWLRKKCANISPREVIIYLRDL
ncbi:protein DA1 [Candidatus Falkowbacteria bacterium]|nr:protein DA1 [Candidatus Falkowbacteria bacterium]